MDERARIASTFSWQLLKTCTVGQTGHTFTQKGRSAVKQTRLAVVCAHEGTETGDHAEEDCVGNGDHGGCCRYIKDFDVRFAK